MGSVSNYGQVNYTLDTQYVEIAFFNTNTCSSGTNPGPFAVASFFENISVSVGTNTRLCSGSTTVRGISNTIVTWDGITLEPSAFTLTFDGIVQTGIPLPANAAPNVGCNYIFNILYGPQIFNTPCGQVIPPIPTTFFQKHEEDFIIAGILLLIIFIVVVFVGAARRRRENTK